jgi:hypothetical protein
MRQTLIILIILLFSVAGFSQSYRTIERAEKAINAGNYDKALKLLNRAEKEDFSYGFCGTARLEAIIMINDLKLRLYKEKGNKEEFKKFLDSIDPFLEFYSNKYSIERLQLALDTFTKEGLNTHIVKALGNYIESPDDYGTNLIPLKMTPDYSLKLHIDVFKVRQMEREKKISFNDALIEYYKQSEYYKKLQE